jgi:hypothetical protein
MADQSLSEQAREAVLKSIIKSAPTVGNSPAGIRDLAEAYALLERELVPNAGVVKNSTWQLFADGAGRETIEVANQASRLVSAITVRALVESPGGAASTANQGARTRLKDAAEALRRLQAAIVAGIDRRR